jgi:hypothetical protein
MPGRQPTDHLPVFCNLDGTICILTGACTGAWECLTDRLSAAHLFQIIWLCLLGGRMMKTTLLFLLAFVVSLLTWTLRARYSVIISILLVGSAIVLAQEIIAQECEDCFPSDSVGHNQAKS